jgi:NAD-dependent dihydropyrimidine dehydrogenase PreA subunit
MCWICKEYGEGTRWYLNPRNYARNMYKVKRPGEQPKGFGADPESQSAARLREIIKTKYEDPEKFTELVRQANQRTVHGPFQIGQVVPLKEAMEMVELAYPLAAMSCVCRIHTRAKEERSEHEYSCMGLGVGMLKWERWPERYKGGVHFMDAEEAKEWLIKWDKKGMVHTVMTFGGTYVGGICNCDYPDCLAIRHRLDYGLELNCLKGHHVAKVDFEKCNGCRVCVSRCQFGAIKFEVTLEKPNIDMQRCFGCGICESGCPREAINLIERESIPVLAEVW